MTRTILASLTLTLLVTTFLPAHLGARPLDPSLQAEDEAASQRDDAYRAGRRALDEERWDDAVRHFDSVSGRSAAAALYWKAYALGKSGERSAALAALSELESKHSSSRWLDDARALAVEMGHGSAGGSSPADEDEELKLLALSSLMNMDPERAVDMLERFLEGDRSEKLRSRALFVLSQNSSERAREILVGTARGNRGRELQMEALRFLGMAGGEASDTLAEIYASTSDPEIKKQILRGYMMGGDKEKVLRVYRTESDPEMRRMAVRQLGMMGAQQEIRDLYASESDGEVRRQLLQSMFMAGDTEGLIRIYNSESDPELKQRVIKNVGMTGSEEGRRFLVETYRGESNPEVKKGILRALFLNQSAEELIAIYRSESDPELKKAAVRQIGMIQSEAAVEFMVQILEEE